MVGFECQTIRFENELLYIVIFVARQHREHASPDLGSSVLKHPVSFSCGLMTDM
jgi:hypothetical protein